MEEKDARSAMSDAEFTAWLELARAGDRKALEEIITLFTPDILRMSKYIHLPKEDAVQSIITDFIEHVRTGVLDKKSKD